MVFCGMLVMCSWCRLMLHCSKTPLPRKIPYERTLKRLTCMVQRHIYIPLDQPVLDIAAAPDVSAAAAAPAVLAAACPCRGAPLSSGWLSEPHSTGGHTCVVCPYHGWAIDGQGKLQDVPSAEPGHWPKRPIVSAYPVSRAAACSTTA
jgi:hypothetical protein